ncbi:class II fumarate hydratase [Paraglaciecola chathamensis]|jgi:fumarate hydratase class II|uniref:fumarate hydratase n=4 Tax=Paraglaciecola chathamensis TaxID=368405 RepID=A0ABS0WBE5_9ALTE|nr:MULTISPECIES: class II fumarate hydratase [Paraglaciecola]AEE23156.1 fumarate lyase [Glaciecola sp. 4H-3-7+YE-5]MBN26137.1 class II fumarate hydratase [Alteromonadaceae bacterium]MBJ2135770.1 class II fumarate hydratase [Paraglaciecola chathamensis]MBU3016983.1 class II fumarate hydratase [Paraglaciecola agarilytica]GAC11925.1 fumarate hydratase, class II [Paraglaciecola chathamensis S18K6]|tara:strand:+ start:5158 stop:6492 length:1335 start_codon:yes stop_codon:yes gene_type:complete
MPTSDDNHTPLYKEQTSLALENFQISGTPMPSEFIHALALIKASAAKANAEVAGLDSEIAIDIQRAAMEVAQGDHDGAFQVDVYQTGSGTSTNMNANEVIATLASSKLGRQVHPNDHVNMGQSSNDVIPSAIHLSATLALSQNLLPALQSLMSAIDAKSVLYRETVKTGRTHLMDAMPITLGQELSGWSKQIQFSISRLIEVLPRISTLALGGTAVGTGINTHPKFAQTTCQHLSQLTGLRFNPADNYFAAISSQDTAVEVSGQLNTLAVSLMKICNDLRWMNSGPLAGLGEISLDKLQAGSSIMPGKVNPVIPEAVAMVCAQVMGYHQSITIAGQSGNFQLNTMLPLIGYNLLTSISILSNGISALTHKAIVTMQANSERMSEYLSKNPILVTALNNKVGYEKGALIAKAAYEEKRPVIEVAAEMTDIPIDELRELLDPSSMT